MCPLAEALGDSREADNACGLPQLPIPGREPDVGLGLRELSGGCEMDRIRTPERMVVAQLRCALTEGFVQLHDHKARPPLVEASPCGSHVGSPYPAFSTGSGQSRMTLHEGDPRTPHQGGLRHQRPDLIASVLEDQQLHQGAGIQVRVQPRSSAM